MRVIDVDGFNATCEARGIRREASLFLLQHETIRPGDLVMVHRGHAMAKMSEEASRAAWALFDEMFEREKAEANSSP
jgi:hydrogenase expression/formation protein HypC